MLNEVGARYPERYRVTLKQRAEHSNQDLRSTQVLTGLNNKNSIFQLWNLVILTLEGMWLVQWNLDLTNFLKKPL